MHFVQTIGKYKHYWCFQQLQRILKMNECLLKVFIVNDLSSWNVQGITNRRKASIHAQFCVQNKSITLMKYTWTNIYCHGHISIEDVILCHIFTGIESQLHHRETQTFSIVSTKAANLLNGNNNRKHLPEERNFFFILFHFDSHRLIKKSLRHRLLHSKFFVNSISMNFVYSPQFLCQSHFHIKLSHEMDNNRFENISLKCVQIKHFIEMKNVHWNFSHCCVRIWMFICQIFDFTRKKELIKNNFVWKKKNKQFGWKENFSLKKSRKSPFNWCGKEIPLNEFLIST